MGCGASSDAGKHDQEPYRGVVPADDKFEATTESEPKLTNLAATGNGSSRNMNTEKHGWANGNNATATHEENGPEGGPQAATPPAKKRKGTLVLQSPEAQPGSLAKDTQVTPESTSLSSSLPRLSTEPQPSQKVSKLPDDVLESATLFLLHFNDVYHIAPMKKEPVGGASRFAHVVHKYQDAYGAEMFFSGDCFNPSLMSTVTKGKHMIPILNALNMQCAVYGNHDFDFGVDELIKLSEACTFPWIISNVVDNNTGEPAARGKEYHIFTMKARGGHKVKVGVMGIAELEWLTCVKDLPPNIVYRDGIKTANRLSAYFRSEGCNFIIALTHMRQHNDEEFASTALDVDLVLGGHDHFYRSVVMKNGVTVLKSGTDFKNLSFLAVELQPGQKPKVTVERIDITSDIPEDPHVGEIVKEFDTSMSEKIGKEICHLECQLDVTTETVRTAECGMGNFVTDVMRDQMEADCAFVNSGILRADVVYYPAPLTLKDLLDMIPIEDVVVLVEITGEVLLKCLENGLSKWPAQEGRFLQVSSITIRVDPDRPVGSRVVAAHVRGQPLQHDRLYKVATTAFLAKGCDGFGALAGCKHIIDEENGSVLPTMCRKAIEAMVPPETQLEKKESIRNIRRSITGSDVERMKQEVRYRKRCFLPTLCPKVEGRIIIEGVSAPLLADTTPQSASVVTTVPVQPLHSPISLPARPTPTNQPVPNSPNPMGHDVVAYILSDVAVVRQAFATFKERITHSSLMFTPEMESYLGKECTVLSQSDAGLVHVVFPDGSSFWFPIEALLIPWASDIPRPAMTPPPLRHALPLNRPPSAAATHGRAPMLQRSQSAALVRDKLTLTASNLDRKRYMPIPKERTMSFIMNPVSDGQILTQKEILERSGVDSSRHLDSRPTSSLGDEARTVGSERDEPDSPKRTVLRSIYDFAWEGNVDGLEGSIAANPSCINTLGVGNPTLWQEHADDHVHVGLGLPSHRAAPLHYAIARGHLAVVKLLIDLGANLTVKSDVGFTPRETACAGLALAMSKGKSDQVGQLQSILRYLDKVNQRRLTADSTAER
eukprot:Sspe_Gene.75476::Locus_47157_Transcript_1_1_Confidence_1.000_Length_3309::g.75476::m.75476/K01081/E3.1.3.5; 5'-nucleotidase